MFGARVPHRAGSAFCSSSGILREGAMSISPRIWRTARMNCLIQATSALGFRVARRSRWRPGRREHQLSTVFVVARVILPRRVSGAANGCDALPDFLGDEGHQRMQRAQQRLEHRDQRAARAALLRVGGVFALQHRLGELQVPVAEFVPGELVQRRGGEIEAVLGERAVYLRQRGGESRHDPAVGDGKFRLRRRGPCHRLDSHQHEARARSTACCRSCGSRRRGRGRS